MREPRASAIHVENLEKRYRDTDALRSIDLDVPAGGVFALLGPNGAGKTTAVRIMATLLRPDSGIVEIDGVDAIKDPHAARNRIGLSGQYAAVDEILTGRENLTMVARLAGFTRRDASARARELLERFDLAAVDKRVAAYSGGMRRRLDLACAMVANPPVVILDEPTTGLDPNGRTELWAVVREMVAAGTTVLLTTQYLEEADAYADSVAVLVGGEIVARGAPGELKREFASEVVTVEFADEESAERAVGVLRGLDAPFARAPGCSAGSSAREERAGSSRSTSSAGSLVSFDVDNAAVDLPTIVSVLSREGVGVVSATSSAPTLDEVFIRLTRGARP